MHFRLRTLLIVVASFLIGLGASLWADHAYYGHPGQRRDIPYIAKLIRTPGEMFTWQLLGDMGTTAEWRFWLTIFGTAFYTCVGLVIAILTGRRHRRRASVNAPPDEAV